MVSAIAGHSPTGGPNAAVGGEVTRRRQDGDAAVHLAGGGRVCAATGDDSTNTMITLLMRARVDSGVPAFGRGAGQGTQGQLVLWEAVETGWDHHTYTVVAPGVLRHIPSGAVGAQGDVQAW